MMRDIFVCPNGHMLENWREAFPKALVTASIKTVPVSERVVFWLHVNVNDFVWLEQTVSDIANKHQVSKIVVLANTPNQVDALAVMRKGAAGYCHAYSAATMLRELKTVVMHGGIWLGNDLLQTLINATKPLVHNAPAMVAEALALLTNREQEIALEAAKGLSNKEIARVCDIAERTVKAHISAVLEKLGVKDRLQLALMLNGKVNESTQNADQAANNVKSIKATTNPNNISAQDETKKKLKQVA